MKKLIKYAMPAAIVFSLAAYSTGSANAKEYEYIKHSHQGVTHMTLSTKNLEPLGRGFDYEGWFIVNGKPVSTGKFDIVNGKTVPDVFHVPAGQAKASTTFVLTIEPAFNDPAAPADTHILAGPMSKGVANIVTNHPAAFGTDFRRSAGTFILATPSNSNATPTKGIWYLRKGKPPTASLNLPKLPAGWRYEGWIAGPKGPVSTGIFTHAAGADSDGPGRTAGPKKNTPPFPGQDFIVPPVDLVGMKAVISVEPWPDNSKAPFSMKPLLTTIKPSNNRLQNISAKNLPSARVVVKF